MRNPRFLFPIARSDSVAPQVIVKRLRHTHIDEDPRRRRAPKEHLPIDFRRVTERPTDAQRSAIIGLSLPLHQHAHNAPNPAPVALARNALLQLHGCMPAALDNFWRHLTRQSGGWRAWFARVAKDADPVKLDILEQCQQRLKLSIRLTRKTDDKLERSVISGIAARRSSMIRRVRSVSGGRRIRRSVSGCACCNGISR